MRKAIKIYGFIFMFFWVLLPQAQSTTFQDIEDVASDVSFLMQQFIAPGVEGTMYQTASGWYTTAKTLEPWEVMVSVQGNFLFIPEGKKTFTVSNNQFRNLTIRGNNTANLQSVAGGVSNDYLDGTIGTQSFEIYSPSGIDASSVFHGQFHLGVGLPYGTQLMARITPKTKIKSTNIQAYGIGLMHNITQWFPKLKASNFDLSVLMALSQYRVDDKFSRFEVVGEFIDGISSKGNTFLTGLVSSKQWGAFDVSLGVLYSTSSPELTFEGEGALLVPTLNNVLDDNSLTEHNITADIGLNYNYKNFSINSIFTIGDFSNLLIGVNYRFNLGSKHSEKEDIQK